MQKNEDKSYDIKGDISKYIEKYSPIYNSIVKDGMFWFTISPTYRTLSIPRLFEHDKEQMLEYINEFAKEYIIVAECTNDRLHYHFVYSLKKGGAIRRGLYKGRFVEARIQFRDLKGEPRKGIMYLFKSVNETIEEYKIKEPILTRDNFAKAKKLRKALEKLQELEAEVKDAISVYGSKVQKPITDYQVSDADTDE